MTLACGLFAGESKEEMVQTTLPTPTLEPTFAPSRSPTDTPSPTPSPTPTLAEPSATVASPRASLSDTISDHGGSVIELVSVASDGTQAKSGGFEPQWHPGPSISADGRYVVFSSWARNLVGNDTNDWPDVFIRDRQTGQTTRLSVASDGSQGNKQSVSPSISADGRYVTFSSWADNLVSGDTNNECDKNGYPAGGLAGIILHCADVFVYDLQTDEISRASIASDGSQGNGNSDSSSISADGRYVAFWSKANNLVSGDTNNTDDVFIHDQQTGQTSRVSVASDGSQGNGLAQRIFVPWAGPPSISDDGRYVAFWFDANNLVNDDTNAKEDVFVHDQQTSQTTIISVASDGSQGNGRSGWPSISADGRYVAFASESNNLVSNDTNNTWDIFVHDRHTGQTNRVSVASDGSEGNGQSGYPSISADGRFVVFSSEANNLVSDDTNNATDVFIHDRQTGQTSRVSVTSDDSQGNNSSLSPAISADGRYVAFWSNANNLVDGDTNNEADVFVHDRGNKLDQNSKVIPVEEVNGGKIAFMFKHELSESWDIYLMKSDGSGLTHLIDSPTDELHPTWSPDGQKIAFASEDESNRGIYVMNADGSGMMQLTDHSVVSDRPLTWSPNGQQIAFASEREGDREIYVMNADGSSLTRLVAGSSPAWSPDGSQIAFEVESDGNFEIYVINIDDSSLTRLTEGGSPAWSPNGHQIAFTSFRTVPPQIYIMNSDGSDLSLLTSGASPTWSPDGKQIIFVDSADFRHGVSYSMIIADGSGSMHLTNSPVMWPSQPVWSPNGRQVAFVADRGNSFGIYVMNADGSNLTRLTDQLGFYGFLDWSR